MFSWKGRIGPIIDDRNQMDDELDKKQETAQQGGMERKMQSLAAIIYTLAVRD